MKIFTRRCIDCGLTGELDVSAEQQEQYLIWEAGGQRTFIQDGLSLLNADAREQILTGTHPSCWDRLFGVEDE